jgi:hypothetical protein
MKKIIQYFKQDKRWLYHCLAAVFNFMFWIFANKNNWLGLAEANFAGIENTYLFSQAFLSLFATYSVAWLVEVYQRVGKETTEEEWRKNAVPDIIFTTAIGFVGFLLSIPFKI